MNKNDEIYSLNGEVNISYFDLQGYWGFTKHMGGLKSTHELLKMCYVNRNKYVLVVGCGVGTTPLYIAKEYGCKVVGVDISEKMVEWSKKRIKREKLESKIDFKVADAQNLPFNDELSDIVICESVNAFIEDKSEAMNEYYRVTKPGGHIGFNECTWIKTPPPKELVLYLNRAMSGANFLTPSGWIELFKNAGLGQITPKTYKITALGQWMDEMNQFGYNDIHDFMKSWGKFFDLLIKRGDFRSYAKEVWPSVSVIKNLFNYLGYGLYVGQKVDK